jgi:hypothetical protein
MGLLAVALLVALVLAGSGGGPTSRTTPPGPTPHQQVKVRVRAAAYLGKPAAQVTRELRGIGLQARVVGRRANPGGHVAGTVAALAPTGLVAKDSVVRLTVWAAPPPPASTPTPTHATSPPQHGKKPPGKGPGQDHGEGKHKGKGH